MHRKNCFQEETKADPNFSLDRNDSLFHTIRIGKRVLKREIVTAKKAKELVKHMHERSEGICNRGGTNTLEKSFASTYFYRRIQQVIKSILDQCNETCKLSKP